MGESRNIIAGTLMVIIVAQFFFGIHYIDTGWAEIIANKSPTQLENLQDILTFIFVIFIIAIVIGTSLYYWGSNRVKVQKFSYWIGIIIAANSFYLFVLLCIQTDLLQYWFVNILLIIPLIISWLIISISIGYIFRESKFSRGSSVLNLIHFLFLVILIGRVIVHFN